MMALQSLSLPSKVDWRIKSNIITLKDIRTRKRFWRKPYLNPMRINRLGDKYYINSYWSVLPYDEKGNPDGCAYIDGKTILNPIENPTEEQKKPETYPNYDYVPLRFFPRWYWWQEHYSFLPLPDKWRLIREEVIGNLANGKPAPLEIKIPGKGDEKWEPPKHAPTKGKDWKPVWDTLEDEEYYILNSGDNIMTVILQNRKQYDWIRPDCVVFFGRNSFSPGGWEREVKKVAYEEEYYKRTNEGKESSSKLVAGEHMPLMYWVKSWRYVDTRHLYSEVILEKCYIWQYYGNFMNTWGTASINKSQINNTHINKKGEALRVDYQIGQAIRAKAHMKHFPDDEDWRDARQKLSSDKDDGDDEVNNAGNDMIWDESVANSHECPACSNCFNFCGDLRNKKAAGPIVSPKEGNKVAQSASWQPGKIKKDEPPKMYKLLYTIFPPQIADLWSNTKKQGMAGVSITDEKGNAVAFCPTNIQLGVWTPKDLEKKTPDPIISPLPNPIPVVEDVAKKMMGSLQTNSNVPSVLFMVDADHRGNIGDLEGKEEVPLANAIRYPKSIRQYTWDYLPKCYTEEPHLLWHSTVQFYFQFKLLFTANCRHLWIRRKEGGFALGYRMLTRSSISGILYVFESLDIFYRWELRVRGSIQDLTLVNRIVSSAIDNTMSRVGDAVKGLAVKGIEAAVDKFSGGLWGKGKSFFGGKSGDASQEYALNKIAESIDRMSKEGTISTSSADEYAKIIGADGEGEDKNKDNAKNEQQTKRKTKKTEKTKEKEVQPSCFYSSTIDFSYDFWEFGNRCVANPFMIRFEHSETLYNNLINNNNVTPLQNHQCSFDAFKQLVVPGPWQGDIRVAFDVKGLWKGIHARGVSYYDNDTYFSADGRILSPQFLPWIPRYKGLQSYTVGSVVNSNAPQGEEDRTYIPGEKGEGTKASANDTTEIERTSLYFSSTCYFVDDETGKDYLPELLDALKSNGSSLHGGVEKRSRGSGETGRYAPHHWHWYYWHDESTQVVSIDVPFSRYSYYLMGFNSNTGDLGDSTTGQEGDKLNVQLIGTNLTIWTSYDKPGRTRTTYKWGKVQADQILNFAQREMTEPTWNDPNTSGNSGIGGFEPDKMPELTDPEKEGKETMFDKPERDMKEKGGDTERDIETELEQEKERKETERREKESQRELEREKEKEKEREKDKEKSEEREMLRERDRARKEAAEKAKVEKELRERKARESKLREKMKKDQEKREKKEREKGR